MGFWGAGSEVSASATAAAAVVRPWLEGVAVKSHPLWWWESNTRKRQTLDLEMVRRASVNWGVEALSMLLPLGELEGQGWGVTNPVGGLSVAVGGGISSEFLGVRGRCLQVRCSSSKRVSGPWSYPSCILLDTFEIIYTCLAGT